MSSSSLVLSPAGVGYSLSAGGVVPGTLSRDYIQPGSIMILLSLPGSGLIPMRVLESDSIASVKLRIQSSRGFVVKNQKLVFDGRELSRNNSSVGDYGLTDGNVLHLAIRVSDIRVITVETSCGKCYTFKVKQNETVAHVRKQLVEKEVDFEECPKLLFEGVELEDHCAISEICRTSDSVIHLLVHKPAKVRTRTVEGDFELSAFAQKVNDVQLIERKPLVKPVVVNPEVELDDLVMDMIRSADAGLEKGYQPIMTSEGTGGAYFMPDESGHKYIGVFKPMDEEPNAINNPRNFLPPSTNGEGLKCGTRVGEGALREVAAYLLDHPASANSTTGFSGVPPTALVQCQLKEQLKIGSLQMFVKNQGSCEDMGPRDFPVQEVHKIAVLDIRLANADRHAGNILFCKGGSGQIVLTPIDHGYCLPENFVDCTFDWLYWPQARQPFNAETVDYIENLDAEEDIELLRYHGWELSLECARVFRISTMLLKKGVRIGLTPKDIGNIMCRESEKKESMIELIVQEAENAVLPLTSEEVFLETVSEIMDRHLNKAFPM
ncbi:hypothetical protein LUZ63_014979 [Rhynchospora breviuscula]|uniref:1-phosphatidylinositol 4-kinase n=1 Tax=Rhynchospora breviuscula TaxID=2022672 RepID=A0A9Q0HLZ7_9POAL|nr:hypothetical protein LUZ63_014979 [Rhynchospora breviuscula]